MRIWEQGALLEAEMSDTEPALAVEFPAPRTVGNEFLLLMNYTVT